MRVQPTYRAAIVGVGRIGSTYDDEVIERHDPAIFRGALRHNGLYTVLPVNHADAYLTTPGYALVAAANRGTAKLRAFGERRGVRALYRDFRRMIAEERPDVVSVCTRSPEKAEVVIAAAEIGVRAIVVEKALATSMAEADAMLAACERHGTILVVNHPNRFSTVNRRAKAVIEAGAIGRVGVISAYGPGGMIHVGTHTFDMLRYWAGDVVEIDARVPEYAPEKDLPARGTLRFASGAIGFFDHTQGSQAGYEVRGTLGSIAVSSLVGDGWLRRVEPFFAAGSRNYPHRVTNEPLEGEPHTQSPTQRMLAELHDTLSAGTPFISTGRDGASALELGLACYASHLADGPVALPLADRTLCVPNR